MEKMELRALGKINLGLDVLGRRENGYHDVRMVMQTVYLYDLIDDVIHHCGIDTHSALSAESFSAYLQKHSFIHLQSPLYNSRFKKKEHRSVPF